MRMPPDAAWRLPIPGGRPRAVAARACRMHGTGAARARVPGPLSVQAVRHRRPNGASASCGHGAKAMPVPYSDTRVRIWVKIRGVDLTCYDLHGWLPGRGCTRRTCGHGQRGRPRRGQASAGCHMWAARVCGGPPIQRASTGTVRPSRREVDTGQDTVHIRGCDAGPLQPDDRTASEAARAPRPAPEAGLHYNGLSRHPPVRQEPEHGVHGILQAQERHPPVQRAGRRPLHGRGAGAPGGAGARKGDIPGGCGRRPAVRVQGQRHRRCARPCRTASPTRPA